MGTRDALMVFHRWAALAGMMFVLILSVTGSALVFEGAIDRGLNPGLWHVTPGAARVPLDSLVALARTAVPKTPVAGITLPTTDDRAVVLQAGAMQVFADPYTGQLKGTRNAADFNRTLPRRLHVLHVSLLGGKPGGTIVGIATIFSLLLVLTGMVLWWPDKLWQIHWGASWKRVVFDLHHVAGIVAAVVLVVITTSGLFIHYESLNASLSKLNSQEPPRPPKQPAAAAGSAAISPDSLVRSAAAALPGAAIVALSVPPKADQVFVAMMRFPEDRTPGGRSRVYVDRFTGAVLQVRSTRDAEMGTRISNSIRSIHTGDVFGKPSEAVWLLAAIVMASQTVTGFMMWWNARKGRAAKRARLAA